MKTENSGESSSVVILGVKVMSAFHYGSPTKITGGISRFPLVLLLPAGENCSLVLIQSKQQSGFPHISSDLESGFPWERSRARGKPLSPVSWGRCTPLLAPFFLGTGQWKCGLTPRPVPDITMRDKLPVGRTLCMYRVGMGHEREWIFFASSPK